MLTSSHLHMKNSEVCIKTRSPPASLPIQGQVTKHTTVKWVILNFRVRMFMLSRNKLRTFAPTVKMSRNRFQVPLWLPIPTLTPVIPSPAMSGSLLSENLLSNMFKSSAFEDCYRVDLGIFFLRTDAQFYYKFLQSIQVTRDPYFRHLNGVLNISLEIFPKKAH